MPSSPPLATLTAAAARRIRPRAGIALALGYAVTGKLALMLALAPGYASAIFPPAGIALAATLIAGPTALPWIFLGSSALNAWVGYQSAAAPGIGVLLSAGAIAAASTLQAWVGGLALRRAVGYPTIFDRGSELIALLLTAPVICTVSATLSVGALSVLEIFAPAEFGLNWATWWVGDTLGVIVVLPIALALAGEPRKLWRSRMVTVALPMAATLVLVVVAYVYASRWEYEGSLRDFENQSQAAANQIQTRFEEQELLLQGIAGFIEHEPERPVTEEEFHRYALRILAHFPVVQAVEWAPRVGAAEREAFERGRRGAPPLAIREVNAQGGRVAAGPRSVYFPLLFVEPKESNQAVFGFDLNSTPDRRTAVERTWATSLPSASAPLRLAQETAEQLGILLVLKVQQSPHMAGVVATALRTRDFVEKSLAGASTFVDLCLTDVESGRVLYGEAACLREGPTFEKTLLYGGRSYLLRTHPSSAYAMTHRGWGSWTALALALFGTGLLGAFLLLNAGTRYRREEEERLALSIFGSELAMTDWDIARNRLIFGEGWTHLLGYRLDELPPRTETLAALVHPEDRALARESMARHLKGETSRLEAEVRLRHKDGRWIWVLARGLAVARDASGRAVRVTGTAKDISERQALQAQLQRNADRISELNAEQNAMLDNDLVGIIKLRDRRTLWANRAMHRIFGYSPGEMSGMAMRALYPDEEAYLALGAAAYPVIHSHATYRTQLAMVRKDGASVWIDLSGVLLSAERDESMWMMVDITAIKRQHEAVEHLAFHDPLTGLPNRMLLADRLERALGAARRSGRMVSVCYLDLDGFKTINDRHGHDAGDRLLKEVAARLLACVRPSDSVCRLGGDEFVLVLDQLLDRGEFDAIVARIGAALRRPVTVDEGVEVTITASIGAAFYPADASDKGLLLRHADHAMYHAKTLGRDRLVCYSEVREH